MDKRVKEIELEFLDTIISKLDNKEDWTEMCFNQYELQYKNLRFRVLKDYMGFRIKVLKEDSQLNDWVPQLIIKRNFVLFSSKNRKMHKILKTLKKIFCISAQAATLNNLEDLLEEVNPKFVRNWKKKLKEKSNG